MRLLLPLSSGMTTMGRVPSRAQCKRPVNTT